VRSLVAKGVLRLDERSKAGHFVKVHLPQEIRALGERESAAGVAGRLDSAGERERRQAIHAREGGYCLNCLGRLRPRVRCLDHVVPRVREGQWLPQPGVCALGM
jgi:hypothetical protein